MNNRILITGATGFVGRALVKRIIELALGEVWVQTRDPQRCTLKGVKAIYNLAEASDTELPNIIINLAGAPIADRRWSAKRKVVLRESRVGLSADLLSACIQRAHTPSAIISASAIGYYGCISHDVDENTPMGEGYAASLCHDWEEQVRHFEELGSRVCILRLGLVLGRGGGVMAKFMPMYRLGLGGRVASGRQGFSWVYIDDVVNVFIDAIVESVFVGCINVVSPNPVSQFEFASVLGEALSRPLLGNMPLSMVKFIFGQMGEELLIHGPFVRPTFLLDRKFNFVHSTLRPAINAILTSS